MSASDASRSGESGGRLVLFAALGGNLGIAVTKLIAAAISGSSSMLTEGIHSLVDSGNQGLLLYGRHRSRRKPDAQHPLGYGRELYFWSFVVALFIFTGGAGVSIYEGIQHVRAPEMPGRPLLNFIVLGIAFLFEGTTLVLAVREFARRKKADEGWWTAFRSSKDPSVFVVLVEDSAALVGIVVAAVFIGITLQTGDARWDGVGSIVIGAVLAAVALVLVVECKGLLVGEAADPELAIALRGRIGAQQGVTAINEVLTVQQAPDQILVMMSIEFEDEMDVTRIEELANRIESQTMVDHPTVRRVFVRPRSQPATRRGEPS